MQQPIGIFDSGFGGLTVVRAVIDLMPQESIVYVGDTGRYPYGSKSLDDVEAYSREITDYLIEVHNVRLVVVACNTASAAALHKLRAEHDVPIVGVIEPGARSVLRASRSGRVGVIGTVGTVGSGAYQELFQNLDPSVELTCTACPGFVEFVERGDTRSEQVHVLARRLLAPLVDAGVDALLLGCTHYPFLARTLSDVLGPDVVLVSSAEETAFEILDSLAPAGTTTEPGKHRFFSSGDVDLFLRLGRRMLGPELVRAEHWAPGQKH